MGSKFYLCLTPWLLFAVVDRSNGQGTTWAGLAALLFTLAIALRPRNAMAFTFANGGALTVFAILTIAGFMFGTHGNLQTFGRVYAASGLAITALISLATRPFTDPYTKDHVAPHEVSTATFRQANTAVTAAWAAAS